MTFDPVDTTLWFAGLGMAAVLLGLLVWKRVYRALPAFFLYFLWSVSYDLASLLFARSLSEEGYVRLYVVQMTLDALFQFVAWIELGRKVLRYNRVAPPNRWVVILLFVLATGLIWCMAHWTVSPHISVARLLFVRLRQTFEIMWVAVLLTAVWLSRILGLRWPERELQIATGFGLNFIVALTVTVLHTHPFADPYYSQLDQISIASYLGTMIYWVLYFSQNDVKQQIFTHKRRDSCY